MGELLGLLSVLLGVACQNGWRWAEDKEGSIPTVLDIFVFRVVIESIYFSFFSQQISILFVFLVLFFYE